MHWLGSTDILLLMPATYEEKIGNWVAARCTQRKNNVEQMPYYVRKWLDVGNNNAPPDEDTAPTARVAGWLMQTVTDTGWDPIDDPDWPRVDPP